MAQEKPKGLAYLQVPAGLPESPGQPLFNGVVDNHPTGGGTLLSRMPESGGQNTHHRFVQIGIGGDDHRIFPPHFSNRLDRESLVVEFIVIGSGLAFAGDGRPHFL